MSIIVTGAFEDAFTPKIQNLTGVHLSDHVFKNKD